MLRERLPSAVMAVLTPLLPAVLVPLRVVRGIWRFRVLRLAVTAALAVALLGLVALLLLMTVLVSSVLAVPQQMAASVLGWVPGNSIDDVPDSVLCIPQPDPVGAPPPLSDSGRLTEESMRFLWAAPAGSSARQVQAWMLYGPTHPGTGWAAFTTGYDRIAPGLSAQATGADVARSMDPDADYRPYLLSAASTALSGAVEGRFTSDGTMEELLSVSVSDACLPDGAEAGMHRRDTGPVAAAEHPSWAPPPGYVPPGTEPPPPPGEPGEPVTEEPVSEPDPGERTAG